MKLLLQLVKFVKLDLKNFRISKNILNIIYTSLSNPFFYLIIGVLIPYTTFLCYNYFGESIFNPDCNNNVWLLIY
jgi:hypothetical protein